jgi:hypothetical protein
MEQLIRAVPDLLTWPFSRFAEESFQLEEGLGLCFFPATNFRFFV